VTPAFVDTSAIYALVVADDRAHAGAARAFESLRREEATLVSSSYVLVEIYALLGRRLGLDAVERVRSDLAPLLDVCWVDRDVHERGLDLLLQQKRRQLSLVDATSFVIMRDRHIERAFAFDRHFAREGFALVA
jgi:predicted nucleic acid-binding protein